MNLRKITLIGFTIALALGVTGLLLLSVQNSALAAQEIHTVDSKILTPQTPLTTTTFIYTNSTPVIPGDGMCTMGFDTSLIDVPENLYVYDVRVGVNISHTYRGDLEVHLVSPQGWGVQLISQSSSPYNHFDVLFDQYSLDPPEGPPGDHDHDPGMPYYDFVWHPEGSLADFYQQPAMGFWTLQICDGVAGDEGILNHWRLELDLGPAIADLSGSTISAPRKVSNYEPINYLITVKNSGATTATNTTLVNPIPDMTNYISGTLVCPEGNCYYDPGHPMGPAIVWNGDIAPYSVDTVGFMVVPFRYGEIENSALLTSDSIIGEFWVSAFTSVYPEIFYNWDFELDDGGFISSYGWEWGMPSPDPIPPDGLYLWGTNLFGEYDDLEPSILTRTVDLTFIPPGTALNLQWWEWFAFDPGDYGTMYINGVESHTVIDYSDGWQHAMLDLSPYAGQTVVLEWAITPNGNEAADFGWYIDNVSIHSAMPETDLGVIKEVSAEPAVIGEQLSYTVTLINQGPITATDVILYDHLSPKVMLDAISPVLPDLECFETFPGVVECTIFAIPPGGAYAVVIDVTPTAAQPGDQIINHAHASATEVDVNPANNHAIVVTNLVETLPTKPQVDSLSTENAVIPVTGQPIQINGANFTPGMSAYLGDYKLQNVTAITPKLLEGSIPYGVIPGTYDLTVVAPNGESGSLLNAFTAMKDAPPTVTGLIPSRGLNDTPVSVFIHGINFSPGISATLYQGTVPVATLESLQFINQNLLRAVVPINIPADTYDLEIVDTRGESDWLSNAYTALDVLNYDDIFGRDTTDYWMFPPSVQQGLTPTVGVNIRRQGGQDTLTNIDVDYYRGAPSISEGGVLLGRATAPTLDPREITSTTLGWSVGLDPGVYTFFGVIDPDNTIPEADESNNIISRSIRILPYDPDYVPLQINAFTINQGAVSTNQPQVYLNVNASAEPPYTTAQPAYLLYTEYQFLQSENDWIQVAQSEWMPYESANTDFAWRLNPTPGIHYLQVWAADRKGNISPQPGLASINLFATESHLAEQEAHIYRYQLEAGKTFLILLESLNGDADLYVWDPLGSDVGRAEIDSGYDELEFMATMSGTYQIEVEGYTSVDYRIQIIPITYSIEQSAPDGIRAPTIRGRGTGLTASMPGGAIGLPAVPTGDIYLPAIMR